MVMEYADLELGIHADQEGAYRVDFRLSLPGSDAEIREATGQPLAVRFDLDRLNQAAFDPLSYGALLTEMFFANPLLSKAFGKARSKASDLAMRLRLRLYIGASATRLHDLRWETLLDPDTRDPLTTDENVLFSRYLASADEVPVRIRPKGSLRALVLVAAPSGVPPIDRAAEFKRARDGLKGIPLTCLPPDGAASAGADPVDPASRPTLENLLAALRAEPCPDVLYLVCHGILRDGEPYLYLEDERGQAARVAGKELVTRLRALQQRPRLVALVSCQSGGSGGLADAASGGAALALSALGPRLADAGVPAVLAMQDDLSAETAARFLPVFFKELQRDGQIDRAMSAARAAVSYQADAWVPALYLRLKSGRLWYQPGFSDRARTAQKFPAIRQNIEQRKFTPILGPGLVEPALGSLREIARRWAAEYNYPMQPHERESLPQVAQFLAINQQLTFPLIELETSLKRHLLETFQPTGPLPTRLNELIERALLGSPPLPANEPHSVLAGLDLPIYITANQDGLLEAALRRCGKSPRVLICPWKDSITQPDGLDNSEIDGVLPEPGAPLVYHLFGVWDQPESVVLTEDDYFQFLMRVSENKNLLPAEMRFALVDSGLMFLGFQIEEWSFRVLFNALLSGPGKSRRADERYAHIAAQIELEDERFLNPALARQFLEKYLLKGANLDIYWGKPQEFIDELVGYLRNTP